MTSTTSEIKSCNRCAHVLGKRYNIEDAKEKWRCGSPNNIQGEELNLVTGQTQRIFRFGIFELRSKSAYTPSGLYNIPHICGSEGAWFEEYKEPEHIVEPTIGGQTGIEIVLDPAALEANRAGAEARIKAIKEKRANKLTNNDLSNL